MITRKEDDSVMIAEVWLTGSQILDERPRSDEWGKGFFVMSRLAWDRQPLNWLLGDRDSGLEPGHFRAIQNLTYVNSLFCASLLTCLVLRIT